MRLVLLAFAHRALVSRVRAQIGMRSKVEGISLGQGQGVLAARLIEEALIKGSWILLQVRTATFCPVVHVLGKSGCGVPFG